MRVRGLPQTMPQPATLLLLIVLQQLLKRAPITSLGKTISRVVASTGRTAKIAVRVALSRRRSPRLLSGRGT